MIAATNLYILDPTEFPAPTLLQPFANFDNKDLQNKRQDRKEMPAVYID